MNEVCNAVREKVVRTLAKQELHTAQQTMDQTLNQDQNDQTL